MPNRVRTRCADWGSPQRREERKERKDIQRPRLKRRRMMHMMRGARFGFGENRNVCGISVFLRRLQGRRRAQAYAPDGGGASMAG